jgi:hypothetical protein
MRARPTVVDVPSIGTVRLTLYHVCPSFHCGRAIGPGVLGQWWAERGLESWVYMWDLDNLRARYPLESAIESVLPVHAADLVRVAQDAHGEGPGD